MSLLYDLSPLDRRQPINRIEETCPGKTMASEHFPSLTSLVNRLASSPFPGDGKKVVPGLQLEVLGEAVNADAFALLKVSVHEEMVTVLEGAGLHTSPEGSRTRQHSVFLTRLASGCGDHQFVFSPESIPEDSFLAAEETRRLLLACTGFGACQVGTLAIRRGGEGFSPLEINRFGAIAYVLNLEASWRLILEENTRFGVRDPVTGLGLFPQFHLTLGKELSRNRRKVGKVTAGILSMEPEDGQDPEEEDVLFVAEALVEQFRDFDTIVRYSRRELAFILPDIGGEEAYGAVERVLKAIIPGGERALPAIHIGFSSYPEDASTVERLIEKAEAAVNLAREKGPFAISRWKD